MSGATEATLQELLASNQQMAASIAKLAGGGGGGGAGGGAGAAKSTSMLGKAAEGAGKALGVASGIVGTALTPALWAAKAGMDALVKTGTALIQNQMQLAQGAIAGTNSLASMTAGLEQLPGILGLAMKAYNYQIQKMEKNVETYQQISTVGARFGGSLDQVRQAAANSYLSMDEFAKVMKEAGPQLRFLGGTTEEGAKNLVKFNSTMIKGEVGRGLLGMGYSLTEANSMLAMYSDSVGGLKASQMKDQKEMEKSVKFFAEELDAAAQLEGKTREQKAAEMKEASQQAAVRAKLSEMGPEEQKKYMAAYNAALRVGGKGAAEALQSQLLGLPPMTKAAQQFVAINGQGAETVKQLGATITDGTKAVDARAKIDKLAAKGQADSAKLYKENSVVFGAISMQGGQLAGTINQTADNMTNMNNMEAKNADELEERTKKVRAEQDKAQKSQVGAIVQAQGAAKHAGGIMDMLYNALKPLIPYILELNDAFMKFLPVMAQFAADVIEKGIGIIKDIFSKVDWGAVKASFMNAWNTLTSTFGGIWEALKKAFGGGDGPSIGVKLQEVFGQLMSGVGKLIDGIGYVIKLFIQSPLFETLKNMFSKMWDLIQSLVDVVVAIVKSPIGTFLINVLFDIFAMFGDIINSIIDVVTGIVDLVSGIFKFISGDFKGGFEAIKGGLGKILGGLLDFIISIPKAVINMIVDFGKLIIDGIKGILMSIIDGIKSIGTSIVNFFSGGGKEEKSSAPASPASPNNPASSSAPTAGNMPPMTKEAQEYAAKNAKTTPVAANAANANAPPVVQPKSNDPIEILRAEIQTLNNITTEMLRAMRDTRDYTKSTANTLASNGNMFKRA